MKEFRIQLASLADVRDFVLAASMQSCDVSVQTDECLIDAKSLFCMVSVDLNEPLTVRFDGNEEMACSFLGSIQSHILV